MGTTGPAGNNVLWLDANRGITLNLGLVSQWADQSGRNNHANQGTIALRPSFAAGFQNGYPAILFDNSTTNPDWMVVTDHASLEGMAALTAFAVWRMNTGIDEEVPRGILSKRDAPNSNYGYAWFLESFTNNVAAAQQFDVGNTSERLQSTDRYDNDLTYLTSTSFNGAASPTSNRMRLFNANLQRGNRSNANTTVPSTTANLYIGSLRGATDFETPRFNGYINEVILYNYNVNNAQRIIINNYLAAKYGLALNGADVYRMDDPSIDHDHEAAGIGRLDALNTHTDARGTGIVRINGSTGLGNNEFLMWGHNNDILGTWGSTDYPPGLQGRWFRTWAVSEKDTAGNPVDVGAVNIGFDLTGFVIGNINHIRLLVDTDADGVFADETPIGPPALLGGLYYFNGVTALTDGVYFTLGTTDIAATPLPIELLHFNASPAFDGSVRIEWSTASERDNDHFMVQRSADTHDWSDLLRVNGAGNSNTVRHYVEYDPTPLAGLSYYRLRQTDLNGDSSYGPSVPVLLEAADDLFLYPSPASSVVNVVCRDPRDVQAIRLFDDLGRLMAAPVLHDGQTSRIDLRHVPSGTYTVLVVTTYDVVKKRLVVTK